MSLSSKTKKHDPTYYLTVTTTNPTATWQIKCPFTTWFTADGYFVAKPFQQWLASSVQAIGDADQKNAAPEEQEVLDAEVVNGTPSASGAESKGKGSKRSKRKG